MSSTVPVHNPLDVYSVEKFEAGLKADSKSMLQSTKAMLETAVSPITGTLNRYSAWKDTLGLRAPGKVDLIGLAAKDCHATNHLFDGAKATLIKGVNANPQFVVQHDFEMGSQVAPSRYRFTANLSSENSLMTGSIDHSGNLQARADRQSRFGASSFQAQISDRSQFVFDHEYNGKDSTFRLTAIDPSLTEGTGAFVTCFLQSITPTLSLGGSSTYFRTPQQPGLDYSIIAKLVSLQKDQWVASTTYSPQQSMIESTYWHKLAPSVEAGAVLTAVLGGGPKMAVATIGAKYQFLTSELRAHIDSAGKVGAVIEQRLNGAMSLVLSGTMDHMKNESKFGFGFTMHQASEAEQMAAMAQMEQAKANPTSATM